MDPCRVCLRHENLTTMEAATRLIFTTCLGLQLENNAVVNICYYCKSKLLDFNSFRELAWTNSEFFNTKIKGEEYVVEALDEYQDENHHANHEPLAMAYPIVKVEMDVLGDNDNDDFEGYNSQFEVKEEAKVVIKKKYKRLSKNPEALDNALRCPMCPRFFETEHQVRRHLKKHETEVGGLTCHFCGKVYGNPQARNRKLLLMHLQRMHFRDPNERYECNICQATFAQKDAVRTHKRFIHEGENKSYVCHICGKAFRNNHKLENHIRFKHDKIILHYCQQCGKGYSSSSSLKSHINIIHLGMKRFSCRICQKKFASKVKRVKHESK